MRPGGAFLILRNEFFFVEKDTLWLWNAITGDANVMSLVEQFSLVTLGLNRTPQVHVVAMLIQFESLQLITFSSTATLVDVGTRSAPRK
jgi:hypothetical protein